ncbi:hypothetical protein VTN96DRAFT_2785 [Rasamsonia emersonii]
MDIGYILTSQVSYRGSAPAVMAAVVTYFLTILQRNQYAIQVFNVLLIDMPFSSSYLTRPPKPPVHPSDPASPSLPRPSSEGDHR